MSSPRCQHATSGQYYRLADGRVVRVSAVAGDRAHVRSVVLERDPVRRWVCTGRPFLVAVADLGERTTLELG